MQNITFKKITDTEAEIFEYIEIEKTAVEKYTYSGIIDFEEAKKQIQKNECFNIYKDNILVGHTEYILKSKEHGHIDGLVILPEFQGQGIAREAALFRIEKMKDLKRIDLVTHPHNSKIICLYLSLGFHIESWKENYWGDGEPRLVIAKIT